MAGYLNRRTNRQRTSMTSETSSTYYLLRSKSTTVGDGPWLGINTEGVHATVSERQQARRFASIEDAERHAGTLSEMHGAFEVEVRTV